MTETIKILESLDKEALKENSNALKDLGEFELASLLDSTVANISAAEVRSGQMKTYSEEHFQKKFARYNNAD